MCRMIFVFLLLSAGSISGWGQYTIENELNDKLLKLEKEFPLNENDFSYDWLDEYEDLWYEIEEHVAVENDLRTRYLISYMKRVNLESDLEYMEDYNAALYKGQHVYNFYYTLKEFEDAYSKQSASYSTLEAMQEEAFNRLKPFVAYEEPAIKAAIAQSDFTENFSAAVFLEFDTDFDAETMEKIVAHTKFDVSHIFWYFINKDMEADDWYAAYDALNSYKTYYKRTNDVYLADIENATDKIDYYYSKQVEEDEFRRQAEEEEKAREKLEDFQEEYYDLAYDYEANNYGSFGDYYYVDYERSPSSYCRTCPDEYSHDFWRWYDDAIEYLANTAEYEHNEVYRLELLSMLWNSLTYKWLGTGTGDEPGRMKEVFLGYTYQDNFEDRKILYDQILNYIAVSNYNTYENEPSRYYYDYWIYKNNCSLCSFWDDMYTTLVDADRNLWYTAQSINTEETYQTYINGANLGNYSSEAEAAMTAVKIENARVNFIDAKRYYGSKVAIATLSGVGAVGGLVGGIYGIQLYTRDEAEGGGEIGHLILGLGGFAVLGALGAVCYISSEDAADYESYYRGVKREYKKYELSFYPTYDPRFSSFGPTARLKF